MSTSYQPIALTPSTAGFGPVSFYNNEDQDELDFSGGWKRRWPCWEGAVRLFQNNIGLLYIIASQLSGTCMNVIVKLLNSIDPPVPTFEIIFIRMFITYIFSITTMYQTSVPHPIAGPPGVRHLLILRGVCGFFGLFGIYYSLVYLSLSDAIVITFLVPTTTAIAGHFLLHESLSRREIIAGLFSFLGVVLIARPEFLFGPHTQSNVPLETELPPAEKGTPTQRLIAVGVALIGVLGGTGAFTSIRAIGKRAHPLHSVAFFCIWSCIVSSLGMIILRVPIVWPQNFMFAVLILGIGVFGFITQLFLTMGLQRETASRGALGVYVQIIFAAIAERWIFHTKPSHLSIIGSIIIVVSAVFVVLTKQTDQGASSKDVNLSNLNHLHIEGERHSIDEADESHGLVSGLKLDRATDIESDAPTKVYPNTAHI